jgi:hypothetical protein
VTRSDAGGGSTLALKVCANNIMLPCHQGRHGPAP